MKEEMQINIDMLLYQQKRVDGMGFFALKRR